MYRDLVGEIIKFTANGRKWYYQQFFTIEGKLTWVHLYDQDGDFITEFRSMEELKEFIEGAE